jgi:hypothetical protein
MTGAQTWVCERGHRRAQVAPGEAARLGLAADGAGLQGPARRGAAHARTHTHTRTRTRTRITHTHKRAHARSHTQRDGRATGSRAWQSPSSPRHLPLPTPSLSPRSPSNRVRSLADARLFGCFPAPPIGWSSVLPPLRAHIQLKVHLKNGSYLVLSDVPSDSLLARKNIAAGDAILTVRCSVLFVFC